MKATGDRLVKDGQAVTLEAIATRLREVDPTGRGIKKAGILGMQKRMLTRKHSGPTAAVEDSNDEKQGSCLHTALTS